MRNYVGLASTFHDSALAIVNADGDVVFAEGTERPLQMKRALNVAPDLVHYAGDVIRAHCASDAELVVAYPWRERKQQPLAELLAQLDQAGAALRQRNPELADLLGIDLETRRYAAASQWQMHEFCGRALGYELARAGFGARIAAHRRYDHHRTHAAAACFTSPFEEAVCAIVDGLGEQRSFAFYAYKDGGLTEIPAPGVGNGSLGLFFTRICASCGFGAFTGEEWKVMGLAPYGDADDPELYPLLKRTLRVNGLCIDRHGPNEELELLRVLRRRARKRGEPARAAANLAAVGQRVFSETLFELLRNLAALGGSRNLVLGGGCALNSSANGGVLANVPFERLYVFNAPADDGNAVGAALLAQRDDQPGRRRPPGFQSPYLGSSMSPETLGNLQRYARDPRIDECRDAPRKAAELLAKGRIVGWIQGHAEFGPRALGNRSILADPRSLEVKDRLNATVKFREEFRPFAPAILHEHGERYFERYQESPYMERALAFRREVIGTVPAVVHVDGTGRLQTVKREWNPRFHALVSAFHEITGVPLVLNTSYNVMGKPIAHSVEDVLAVFHTSGLDAVFIENVCIEKA
jgi:carbamoyltransferase